MRVFSWLLALFTACAMGVAAQGAGAPTGSVSGSVTCTDSQTPCRFASVTIETAPPKEGSGRSTPVQTQSYSANSDIDGTFRIDHVLPGDYYVLPRLEGYLSPYDIAANDFRDNGGRENPPQKIMDATLTRITVAAGQTTFVSLSLARGASLGGTVLYDDGAPGINLPIHLYRQDSKGVWEQYWNLSGDSPLAPLGLGPHTDDRGRYYEPGLPPGKYKVEATLPIDVFSTRAITGRSVLNVTNSEGNALQIFNGGAYRLESAPAIELSQGEDRSGIDVTIPMDGLRTVSGVVIASASQQPITSGAVRLLDPQDKSVLRETNLSSDGSFVFKYVVDGSYLLQVEAKGSYAEMTAPLVVAGDITDLNYALTSAGH